MRGWASSISASSPQACANSRFHICIRPSGANTATASNRLSNVAVRVRSSVSRIAEMRKVSVRSSTTISKPPSGIGWATTRKWVPSDSGHCSSMAPLAANHWARSLRHAR